MQFIEAYNVIDLFILGTLLVTLIFGLWKGFMRSLTAVAGLIVGVAGSLRYYTIVEPYLGKISALDPHISMILSIVIVFIAIQALFVLLRRILTALIDVTRLSWLDRVLGGMLGVFAGFLLIAATVQVILIVVPDWSLVKSSRLVNPMNDLTNKAMTYAPEPAREYVQSLIAKWKGTPRPSPPKQPGQDAPVEKPPTTPPGLGKQD
ncbi:MAG: CvpA family protein [Desulfomonilaceae bacterium]|nr:CvpA family protein [Desulfomonilaceae bacterium]